MCEPTDNVGDETISAAELKARCLTLLVEVAESGKSLTITKDGKAIASLKLLAQKPRVPLLGALKGSVIASTDLLCSVGEKWEANN